MILLFILTCTKIVTKTEGHRGFHRCSRIAVQISLLFFSQITNQNTIIHNDLQTAQIKICHVLSPI